MRIEREYHFYAAHRNQTLGGKCGNLHGHRYGVVVVIEPERTRAGITMLFADIDRIIAPIITAHDHALLIDKNDPLHALLGSEHQLIDGSEPPSLSKSQLKVAVFDGETSVENLARSLYEQCADAGLPMSEVRVRETDSSVVIYDFEDYFQDRGQRR